jgi:DNA-directed RNA polymerase subunit K/omega
MEETKTPRRRASRKEPTAEPIVELEEQSEEETLHIARHEPVERPLSGSRLPWLIHDFTGITDNVYEGVMVAAVRARQIGRRQKHEIDAWYKSHEPVDGQGEEEETEPGSDHFQHTKPTVKALDELAEKKLEYKYLENES